MAGAVDAARRHDWTMTTRFVAATALGGLAFLGMRADE
jgi:hypothetical protein